MGPWTVLGSFMAIYTGLGGFHGWLTGDDGVLCVIHGNSEGIHGMLIVHRRTLFGSHEPARGLHGMMRGVRDVLTGLSEVVINGDNMITIYSR
jgi:hypothetical protein